VTEITEEEEDAEAEDEYNDNDNDNDDDEDEEEEEDDDDETNYWNVNSLDTVWLGDVFDTNMDGTNRLMFDAKDVAGVKMAVAQKLYSYVESPFDSVFRHALFASPAAKGMAFSFFPFTFFFF
jgi:hypothetical protein